MNYKSLILAAFLLPSFSYSLSKEEQIKQLKNESDRAHVEMTILNESLAYEAFLAFMGGKDTSASKSIVKELRKLQKQLKKINQKLAKLGVIYE